VLLQVRTLLHSKAGGIYALSLRQECYAPPFAHPKNNTQKVGRQPSHRSLLLRWVFIVYSTRSIVVVIAVDTGHGEPLPPLSKFGMR
jgi:hypothetical protein